jgi:hypothetical protein
VDYSVTPCRNALQGRRLQQVAVDELDARVKQLCSTRAIAHEGANMIAALGESSRQSASDFSGGTGH